VQQTVGSSRPLLTAVLVAALALAGCGGSDADTALSRAEAQVTAKERALATAEAEAEAASAEFCGASKTYISALDRYGDVLNSTAPTVGDVRDAGADLAEPQGDADRAAEQAVAAREEYQTAKQELTEARAALDEVRSNADPPSSSAGATKSPSPATLPPPPPTESVDRVKQAEAELDSAQEGVTDQTPLVQAGQQFNAAAVALEMSWLRLYADAGCLADDEQDRAADAAADYTLALQHSLSEAGYYQGAVDGIYGPETVDAVETLQQAHGLPVTGTMDRASAAALESELRAKGGAAAEEAVAATAAVQQTLKLAGFWDGPVDGSWTPELTEALKSFQTELGVAPTGTVDAATVGAVERASEDLRSPEPSPSPSESESSPPASETGASSSPD
jgi:peptidoglycan hydrolase-like protein with peptidoglycan-binding domain